MLNIHNIYTGYGKKPVIFDLSINVKNNEIVSIIGPNGAGKSTILKAVCGIIPVWKGDVQFLENSIITNTITNNIKLGLTYCPQGNRVFDELNVLENLETGGYLLHKDKLEDRIDNVLKVFPVLKERIKQNAGTLSGGEQQMLAIARALIPEPKLLLLDEPSLGLAPNLLDKMFEKLIEIKENSDTSLLIVEQKVKDILAISDRTYSIKLGKVSFDGLSKELIDNKKKIRELFL